MKWIKHVVFCKGMWSKSGSREAKGVPLVITFHPKLKSIGQLLSKKQRILYMDQKTKNFYAPGSMATFLSARKLSSYLERTKLRPI